MESKAPMSSLCLHKEVRLSLEPVSNSSLVQLQLPSTSAFSRATRVVQKVADAIPTSKSEEEFKRRNVSSAGSVYFRHTRKYPRSILWRCLENNTVLELRSIDLSKGEDETKEAGLVLRFGFQSTIRNEGVALADSTEEDALSVFVLTKSNELYTLTTKSHFFCQASASEDEFERWCKTFKPSSLSISTPFRLVALGPLNVLITLTDGRIVHLRRRQGEDGSSWDEAAYNDGKWGSSLRGLIRWQGSNTIHYDGNALDQNTAVNAMISPDGQHILAVGLNHTLKFWNMSSGRPTASRDLLDVSREPQEIAKLMLDPGAYKILDVFEAQAGYDGDLYYAMTYSPHASGIFKVWGVRDPDHNEFGVRDLFPDDTLRVPDPDDGALWTMLDFKLKTVSGSSRLEVWILIRLNRRYKLYHRKFVELRGLGEDWQYDWSVTAIDMSKREPSNGPPSKISSLDYDGITDKWINFISCPGRIAETVLDTALHIYIQTRGLNMPKANKACLIERIASCVASQLYLQHAETPDSITKFSEDLNGEWSTFWNIATEVDQARWEPLSLGFDAHSDIPWIVLGDGCSAIRECSEIEMLAYNKPKSLFGNNIKTLVPSVEIDGSSASPRAPDELAMLIEAAAKFRVSFSEILASSCKNYLDSELWQDSSYSVPARIQSFYDHCGFADEVGDRQYNELAGSLNGLGGFDGITTDSVTAILETLPGRLSEASGFISTKFGLKVLVGGAQDMIVLHTRILTDLLYLVVFVEMEVDPEEHAMENLDAARIFMDLLEQLRRSQMANWLATNTRQDPVTTREKNSANLATMVSDMPSPGSISTILENLFARDIKPQSYSSQSQSAASTQTICDLLTWVAGGNEITLDKVLVNIQCDFLKNVNVDLASSFLRFQPSTAWATYIRGRLCLLRHEFTEAAIHFKKSAFKLSRPKPPASEYAVASASLLDPLTASFLANGLPNYYNHIINLFSSHRAYTYIISFSQLALQHCHSNSSPDLRSDLLARLFHASLEISDYRTAYSALTRYTDSALQKSALTSLVTAMVSTGSIKDLLALPFATLHQDVDSLLSEKARAELDLPLTVTARTVPFFKILYAWRLRHGDHRGAAAILIERLEARRQRQATAKSRVGGGQKEAEKALDEYLVGINALAMVGGEEGGWVFVEGTKGERKVVTLGDLRDRYQEEMDRVGILEMGRFEFLENMGDDAEDEEEDVDMEE